MSVYVVVYWPDRAELSGTLTSLGVACEALHTRRPGLPVALYLVDNGGLPDVRAALGALHSQDVSSTILAGHGNVGYGQGHNLAIERAAGRSPTLLDLSIL